MRTHTFVVVISLAVAVFCLTFAAETTHANRFLIVDRLDDVVIAATCTDAPDDCTLRGAVMNANSRSDESTVIVPAGTYTLSRVGDETDGLFGDLDITAPFVEIRGAGADTIVDAELVDDGIFSVHSEATVVIKDMMLQNTKLSTVQNRGGDLTVRNVTMLSGDATSSGGGAMFINGGATRIEHTMLVKNAADSGGAIFIQGLEPSVTIVDSEILANSSGFFRGAIAVFATDPDIVIERSTLSGNESVSGGAIYNAAVQGSGQGSFLISNSTLSGNAASVSPAGKGNAIYQESEALSPVFETSTIAANNGAVGTTAIYSVSGVVSLTASIVSNSPANCLTGHAQSIGIGSNVVSDASCILTGPGDMNDVDPMLEGLADNGGPTMTHMLLDGSPAIDLLDSCLEGLDQRGRWRPVGDFCDAGAVEFGISNLTGFVPWGNVDCDSGIGIFDVLLILEFAAVGNENTSVGDCPDIGNYTYVDFETAVFAAALWGDINCDGVIDGIDALYVLLFDDTNGTGLPDPPNPCPEVGQEIEDGG